MSQLHTRIEVTVELLSPLHIGSGTELLLDYDIVPYGEHTYRVNEEALLEQALLQAESEGAAAVNQVLAGRPAAELLTEADFADPHSPLFRYVMPGTPFTTTAGAKVQEQIKDVHDQLYLPGSSLKGALRTVLAWGIYAGQKRKPDLGKLKRSRSWAAQPLEQELFGRDPNRDFLRALHVEDSAPLEAADALRLEQVQVYPGGTPIDVEAVRAGVVFHLTIAVDEYGFQDEAARQLGWQEKRAWLGQLVALGKAYAGERLAAEAEFFKGRGGPQATLGFYVARIKQVAEGELADDEFLLQVGWGTGWESKTLGSGLLRQDDAAFERMLRQYRMTKEKGREEGDPFPKSRTLALRGGEPALPLGWVRVKLGGFVPGKPPQPVRIRPERPPAPTESRPRRPEDLQPGQVLEGTVRNIASFGAFVDIGVGRDGLVHISQLAEGYVTNVEEVVQVGRRVRVKVLSVERREGKWRISLTMKGME
ncbi:MAG TPA: type III-A CRISPR-associated RAMP protein Csm5 [Anaerolineae bacterium]|nr:type III-A CRISPR-associated RAMP protein Csm5 [Anaerolineae bacterium]